MFVYLLTTFNWRLWRQNGISPLYIIWCEFLKHIGFRYIFFHGYEWTIINLTKLQYKTEHLAKYQLNIFCFYYNVWPSYVNLSQYRRKYISKICLCRSNATCASLSRNINGCLRQVSAQCFTTLVLPKIEHAATVWDPYIEFNINTLGKCQCRAARFVNGDYLRESSATSMLKELKWPPLQQRRTNTKMVMMYRRPWPKIVNTILE
jgi:hypothetical protein